MTLNLSPIVSNYYLCDKFVSLIIGPIGSGKTLGSIAKLDRLIYEQEPSKDGIRYTRTVVVRNTYTELEDTTMKSFDEFYGDLLHWSGKNAIYKHDDVHAEFIFRSLDKPQDMKKLLSLEITYAYLNEVRELSKEALDNVTSRLGRYPSVNSGIRATKPQCIGDSNACGDQHWMYKLFVTDYRPDNYALFIQPPAIDEEGNVNQNAENLDNLPYEYYRGQLAGKETDWIDQMIRVKFIEKKEGKPVYPEYSDTIHMIDHEKIKPPSKDLPLICGSDNGRWSGFVIGQVDPLGRLVIFDELVSDDVNLTDFSEIIRSHMQQHYPGYRFETWIDPWAANQRGQLTDATMFKVYNKSELHPRVSNTGSPLTMVEAVKRKLGMIIVGQPAIVISNKCKHLLAGLRGGYQYRRINVSAEKYAEKPDKGPYSHICNAFEMLVDGMGASRELLAKHNHSRPIQINTEWSPI